LFIPHATIPLKAGREGDKQRSKPEDLPHEIFIIGLSGERQEMY
jgi:hypothetical protein